MYSYLPFHPPIWLPTTRNVDAKLSTCAYIYTLWTSFFQVAKNCQVIIWQIVGGVFSMFFFINKKRPTKFGKLLEII
jgi:hypothetical protein